MTFSLGWLAFSVPGRDLNDVAPWLWLYGVRDWVELSSGRSFYRRSARGVNGVTVLWDRSDAELVHVVVPQSHLDAMGTRKARRLLREVLRKRGHLTRLDLTYDDLDRVTDIATALGAIRDGNLVTRAKSARMIGDLQLLGDGSNVVQGQGFYIGRRSSDSFLRCYDKALERARLEVQDGEAFGRLKSQHGNRWELELHDDRATEAARRIVAADVGELLEEAVGLLRNFCDFRDRSADTNVSRTPLLDWWVVFTGAAVAARLALPRPAQTLGGLSHWARKAVSPSLAVLVRSWGPDWMSRLDDLILHGEQRWTARHLELLLT